MFIPILIAGGLCYFAYKYYHEPIPGPHALTDDQINILQLKEEPINPMKYVSKEQSSNPMSAKTWQEWGFEYTERQVEAADAKYRSPFARTEPMPVYVGDTGTGRNRFKDLINREN